MVRLPGEEQHQPLLLRTVTQFVTAERLEAFAGYQVNDALFAHAAPDAIFMHCLPAHRGSEVTAEVLDGRQSVVLDQSENRMYVQKAILQALFS